MNTTVHNPRSTMSDSQVSRYEASSGMMMTKNTAYGLLVGFALGMGIMHVLHRKKIM